MDYENLLALCKRRRSIRGYKPEPVHIGDVLKVVEAARWAPSGTNSQPWEFIVIRDKDKLQQIKEILSEGVRVARESCPRFAFMSIGYLRDVSTFIVVCTDPRFKRTFPQSDINPEPR